MSVSRKLPELPDGVCVSDEDLVEEAEESETLVAVGQELFDMVENVVLDKRNYSQREWFIIARYLVGALEGVEYAVVVDND